MKDKQHELICIIVNFGVASKALHIAREHGLPGGTIFLGKGTVRSNRLLDILELTDIRKEILIMAAEKSMATSVLEEVVKKLKLNKANQGIAFTMPLFAFLGRGDYDFECDLVSGGVPSTMYQSIFTIVDKGKGDLVMDAANKAGARGGTLINARGAGIHERSSLLHMDIEPEKEVVLIISQTKSTKAIVKAIRKDLEIDKPGNGIIFVRMSLRPMD